MNSSWDYDYVCKIVVVGDAGCGKSSMLMRYIDSEFHTDMLTTIGVDFKLKTMEVEGKIIKVQFWDTAGQERFKSIVSGYYRGADGVLVTYDVTNNSFYNVPRWLNEIHQGSGRDTKIMLVATKCDDVYNRVIDRQKGEELAARHNIPYIETSAKKNMNIDECFDGIVNNVIKSDFIASKRAKAALVPLPTTQPIREESMCFGSNGCSIM
ncbi:Ras-related protein Sec [Acrasis kona]|uniref:Ras-related protein Sec n=1 Tax=Acrasis kona TaxID=1008807 RepID=A0AAW2Z0B6_9EUKA